MINRNLLKTKAKAEGDKLELAKVFVLFSFSFMSLFMLVAVSIALLCVVFFMVLSSILSNGFLINIAIAACLSVAIFMILGVCEK